VDVLCELAELVVRETGEPLDAVQSYANFTLQNTVLESRGLERLKKAGVAVVPNASILGMGLMRSQGVPVGGSGDFHPASMELRVKALEAAKFIDERGESLEVVAIRWGLDRWSRVGAGVGGVGAIGVSVMGVSNLDELEETMKVWNSVLDGLPGGERRVVKQDRDWSIKRRKEVESLAEGIWKVLGQWKDYAWASPDAGYINMRTVKGIVDEVAPMPILNNSISKTSRL
jgi:D-arabinose 1-dehydrogenase